VFHSPFGQKCLLYKARAPLRSESTDSKAPAGVHNIAAPPGGTSQRSHPRHGNSGGRVAVDPRPPTRTPRAPP